VRMADRHCLSLIVGAAQSKLELFADRAYFGVVIEEGNVAESRRNAKILRRLVRHGSGGGAAVDIEETMIAQDGHQLIHQRGVSRGLRSLMIVDAGGIRNILQKLSDFLRNLLRRHTGTELLRFGRLVRDRLHGKVKHDLESTAMRFLGNFPRVFVIGQDRDREGEPQREDGFGRGTVAAKIVDDDRQTGAASGLAGIFDSGTGLEWSARNDFYFQRRNTCPPKLELVEVSGLDWRILRQMISNGGGIKALQELCQRRAVRIRGRGILQNNPKVSRISGGFAGDALPKLYGGSARSRGRGSRR